MLAADTDMRTLLKSIVLAAILLGTHAAPAVQGNGPDRFVPSFAKVQQDKGEIFREGCLIFGPTVRSGPCVYGDPDSARVVVVFGDSHALHWTPAILRVARARNWRVVALLRANCTSAVVNTDPVCNRWRQHSLSRIKRMKPSLVILGTNTGQNVLVRDRKGQTLSRQKSGKQLEAGMVVTIKKMLANGSRVTLMRDLFTADFDPSNCVQQNIGNPARCSFAANRPEWLSFDYRAARKVRRTQIIDPLPKVCPGGTCKATFGNILKFRDRAHLSATYVATLGGWLGQRLQRP